MSHEEREHARLSPSSAKRWLNCSKCVTLEESLPNTTSEQANEGTKAHELSELKVHHYIYNLTQSNITQDENSNLLIEIRGKEITADSEMKTLTNDYGIYCAKEYKRIRENSKGVYYGVEERLDLSSFIPEGFGSVDFYIVSNNEISVVDFKYGRVKVGAFKNEQLYIYALGVVEEWNFLYNFNLDTKINLTIYQPRCRNIETESITLNELIDFREDVKKYSLIAFNNEGNYNAGEWCKYCKGRAICLEYLNKNVLEKISN